MLPRRPWIILLGLSLAACSLPHRELQVGEYLDEDSGYTVTYLGEPLLLYRDQPALAAHARDYLSLGPAILSRGGREEYLLWICSWTTIDRSSPPAMPGGELALLLDGEMMELPLRQPPPLGRLPYHRPINGGRVQYYRLTRSQMLQLLNSDSLRALPGEPGAREEFRPWHDPRAALAMLAGYLPGDARRLARGE